MAHAHYLTFEEYREYGGVLEAAAFLPLEMLARKRIDYLTLSRIQQMEAVPDAVRLCMVSLVRMENAAGAEAQAIDPAITSFGTDGYSESRGNAMDAKTAQLQMNGLVKMYLHGELDDNGTPLLYRGVAG